MANLLLNDKVNVAKMDAMLYFPYYTKYKYHN